MSEGPVDWKADSRSFDRVAALYDTYRPRYPQELVDYVIAATRLPPHGRILEIGSGTGIATLPFAQRGYSILCLEPGANLAELARQKLRRYPAVRFSLTAFEDWQPAGELFDLLISAQAFHWTDQATRFSRAARVLSDTGHLALFWNQYQPQAGPLVDAIDRAYRQFAPELAAGRPQGYQGDPGYWEKAIVDSPEFDLLEIKLFPWQVVYSTSEYLGLLNTYSDHLRLSADRRRQLFSVIAAALEEHGGEVEKRYQAELYIAAKTHQKG